MRVTDDKRLVAEWMDHWRDEADAEYLYGQLATIERDPKRSEVFRRLADVEARHVEVWRKLLADHGVEVGAVKPSLRARLQAWVARRFGPSILLTGLLREEGHEVKGYLDLHERSEPGRAKEATRVLARESAEHAEELRGLSDQGADQEGEPWHRTGSGDFLRNVVYGFNDGLTANFGLVAGVLGATDPSGPGRFVLISGLAGVVADALSMGSSGYLAAKSQREVHQREIDLERQEIALMPELETEELALLYQAKGVEPEQARRLAGQVMGSDRALEEKVREELRIRHSSSTPLREGWITGVATAVGAFIPVVPFLFARGGVAIWTSFSIAMLSHFVVGAARSLFTGRGIFRSGFDMFVVGMGVAGIGYVAGDRLVSLL